MSGMREDRPEDPPESSKTVVIMAGGEGTRLYPATQFFPKPLWSFKGKPILYHIFDHCIRHGYRKFVVCTQEKYVDEFSTSCNYYRPPGRMDDLEFNISVGAGNYGTADRVLHANRYLKSDRFLVYYGDTILDLDLKLLENGWDEKCIANIVVCDVPLDIGVVRHKGSIIESIWEKPPISSLGYIANVGVGLFSREILKYIPWNIGADIFGDGLSRAIQSGWTALCTITPTFLDIGSYPALRRALNVE